MDVTTCDISQRNKNNFKTNMQPSTLCVYQFIYSPPNFQFWFDQYYVKLII